MARFWWEKINPVTGTRILCCVEGCGEKSGYLLCDNAYRSTDEEAYVFFSACKTHASESGWPFVKRELVNG